MKYRKFNININIPFESFLSKKFSSLQSAYMLGVSMNWSSLSNINLWEKKTYKSLYPAMWRATWLFPRVLIHSEQLALRYAKNQQVVTDIGSISSALLVLPKKRQLDVWVAYHVCDLNLVYTQLQNAGNGRCH